MNALLFQAPPLTCARASLRRSYDHRIRRIFKATRDESLLEEHDVPRSTGRSWLQRELPDVVALDDFPSPIEHLEIELRRQRRRNRRLVSVMRLLLALVAVRHARLDPERLPKGHDKLRLLRAVDAAASELGLRAALKVLGLDLSRYHRWSRAHRLCGLDGLVDKSSCPRSRPYQIGATELLRMKQMVLDQALRHMPLSTLAMYAQRIGAVIASPSTWS